VIKKRGQLPVQVVPPNQMPPPSQPQNPHKERNDNMATRRIFKDSKEKGKENYNILPHPTMKNPKLHSVLIDERI